MGGKRGGRVARSTFSLPYKRGKENRIEKERGLGSIPSWRRKKR